MGKASGSGLKSKQRRGIKPKGSASKECRRAPTHLTKGRYQFHGDLSVFFKLCTEARCLKDILDVIAQAERPERDAFLPRGTKRGDHRFFIKNYNDLIIPSHHLRLPDTALRNMVVTRSMCLCSKNRTRPMTRSMTRCIRLCSQGRKSTRVQYFAITIYRHHHCVF